MLNYLKLFFKICLFIYLIWHPLYSITLIFKLTKKDKCILIQKIQNMLIIEDVCMCV